jgi:hypothetical protein
MFPMSDIIVKGAREHNLQNVDLVLQRYQTAARAKHDKMGRVYVPVDFL